jgi:hypothetical protein
MLFSLAILASPIIFIHQGGPKCTSSAGKTLDLNSNLALGNLYKQAFSDGEVEGANNNPETITDMSVSEVLQRSNCCFKLPEFVACG